MNTVHKSTAHPVLDHGYVRLFRRDGSDEDIVCAAQISYDKRPCDNKVSSFRLLDFLYREHHTSPFEMAGLVLEIRAPLYVFGHFVRHRTASVNVQSYRYTRAKSEYYLPVRARGNAPHNKQASKYLKDPELDAQMRSVIEQNAERAFAAYEELINAGVSREQARGVLPQNIYTTFVWSMDLNNLAKFLKLRLANDAQWETVQYAKAIARIVSSEFPETFKAWVKHDGETFGGGALDDDDEIVLISDEEYPESKDYLESK